MLAYRSLAVALAVGFAALSIKAPVPSEAQTSVHLGAQPTYRLTLPNGKYAEVYADGMARIYPSAKNRTRVEIRRIPLSENVGKVARGQLPQRVLPDKARVAFELTKDAQRRPYAPGEVVVVYRAGVSSPQDTVSIGVSTLAALRQTAARHQTAALLAPQYTTDSLTNVALAKLGVDRSERLFQQFNRSALSAMHANAQANGAAVLDFTNAYKLHVSNASVPHAVQALAKLPGVAYVSPNWVVSSMATIPITLSHAGAVRAAVPAIHVLRGTASVIAPQYVPSNYADASSLQSMLNAPSDDVIAAYDEIQRHFHELPGQGEIVTNVSIGDLDDASAASNTNDQCGAWVNAFGPTTQIIGGQRYLNMPSMPLIPTYTSGAAGTLNPIGETCGNDPFLGEVDLDFSMMAPLPHDAQRSGEQGSGLTDLLGIAPGAQYRLVVPGNGTSITGIQGAFLAAALQTPRPNVITASLGYGLDVYGFPTRYLEEDPLTEAIVASIVQNYHIMVCISAGDGTRTFTNAAIGPSGGSAAENVVSPGGTPTNLNDLSFSTAPSTVFDSGSLAAGGTTLDDIFSDPPQYEHGVLQAQHAFPETRWTGFTSFSSGFGTRVNVSAPSDNVVAFSHSAGGAYDAVDIGLSGGTSASSPEIAATVAVVEQVARLTGHPFSDPVQARRFLERTGSPVPNVAQADTNLHVGPQVDLRRAVETLLQQAGIHDDASVARVAVEQRRSLNQGLDNVFISDTDPTNINLGGTFDYIGSPSVCPPNPDANCEPQALDEYAWITIAPDWEFVPTDARYALRVAGTSRVLATTPWARLQPETILNAAGLPLVSNATRTVRLEYSAGSGRKSVSSAFSLTFSPAPQYSDETLAPRVPSIVHGSTIPVTYDVSHILPAHRQGQPAYLVVSTPGRSNAYTGDNYNRGYVVPLQELRGTVQVPVSALHGGGVYGITVCSFCDSTIRYGMGYPNTDYAFARVVPQQSSDVRPSAPLLSYGGSTPGHGLEIPGNGTFQLSYDVTNVPGATNAELEISATAPNTFSSFNTFDNPNGSERDEDGMDSGSIYYAPLSGTAGTVTLNGNALGLASAMYHTLRVLPMKGGVAAGEASDVSTITMDGILPSDGGEPVAFGVNGNGFDGDLVSIQSGASGQIISSLETFDQTTNAISHTVASEESDPNLPDSYYNSISNLRSDGMIFGNDVGLAARFTQTVSQGTGNAFQTAQFNLLNPVANGTLGPAWSPPAPFAIPGEYPGGGILRSAANQANDDIAFLALDPTAAANDQWRVFSSNLLTGASSAPIDISGPVEQFGPPYFGGTYFAFAEDTSNRTVVAAGLNNSTFDCAEPTYFAAVDLSKRTVDSFVDPEGGYASDAAIDSSTHRMITISACPAFRVYDLSTKSLLAKGGGDTLWTPMFVAADPIHHLFLIADAQPVPYTSVQKSTNNNLTQSRVLVFDEHGSLQKVIQKFQLPGWILPSSMLQLNSATRTGYIVSWFDGELASFKY